MSAIKEDGGRAEKRGGKRAGGKLVILVARNANGWNNCHSIMNYFAIS